MTGRAIVVLGAGGHGRVVAELVVALGRSVAGFLDPGQPVGTSVLGFPILGPGDDLDETNAALSPYAYFPALGSTEGRCREYFRLIEAGADVPALVHPSAVVSPSAAVEAGTVVMAGAVVQSCARLGPATIINTGARIDHDCIIGTGVMIAPGAVLCGNVEVGDRAFIAAGAVITPGVRIGSGAFVGAGTMVARDVAAGTRVRVLRPAGGA